MHIGCTTISTSASKQGVASPEDRNTQYRQIHVQIVNGFTERLRHRQLESVPGSMLSRSQIPIYIEAAMQFRGLDMHVYLYQIVASYCRRCSHFPLRWRITAQRLQFHPITTLTILSKNR
jgi:ABC-type antimicrobial peptide transport system ATPase subunit